METAKSNQPQKKRSFWGTVTYFLMLNFGILLLASGIYFFKATNGFATGGVSGISILFAKLLGDVLPGITQGMYMTAINIILLILGVIILGKQCGLLTIYCSIVLSLENMLFEYVLPLSQPLTDEPVLELVYAVMLTGIGSAIIFRCNASSGGTDIVALILKKYTSLNTGTALLCSDLVIAASSLFIYDIKTGLFSLLGLFAKVFVVDDILDSMNMCKAFTIITTKPEEIERFIMEEMKRGATAYNAEGTYSHMEKKVIITVCKRTEALRLRRKVKQIDPSAFIIITKTSEIMGKGFRDV
ncbi:MAG: YitT family protein [Clostridia bacterium]|nr:YitT family protein [Clostridia bacterium]